MNTPGTLNTDNRIRVIVAAEGDTATRLARVFSGEYVSVVAIANLDRDIVDIVRTLDPDILVMAGGGAIAAAREIAQEVAAAASRVSVMIVDEPGAVTDTRVFWPQDRTYRTAAAIEPAPQPLVGDVLLACA
jgi:ribosomal protein L18